MVSTCDDYMLTIGKLKADYKRLKQINSQLRIQLTNALSEANRFEEAYIKIYKELQEVKNK